MITLSIVFLVMVIITLGILWMLERPRARLQVGDSDSSEAPVSMDDLDLAIASTYYAKGLLARGLVPSFEYYTMDELARMYGITQEEVERRRKKLQERIPWIGEVIG